MKKVRIFILLLVVFLFSTVFVGYARDIMPDTWVLTDELGRKAGTNETVGNRNTSRKIGIFYFLWHQALEGTLYDHHRAYMQGGTAKVWEIMQLGPKGYAHYWSEPYFGYYSTEDPWIIRKHMQMLTDAGVDFLYFDTTNGHIYEDSVTVILETMLAMKKEGADVPKVCFNLGSTAHLINSSYPVMWENFYSSGVYDELMFTWQGKPLVLMDTTVLTSLQDTVSHFTTRESWTGPTWYGDGNNKWPWLYEYPQKVGKSPSGATEQVVVSCGFHANSSRGRSYHGGAQPSGGGDFQFELSTTGVGLAFAEQWTRVMAVKPSVVMITGWNEWWAGRWDDGAGNGQKIANTYISNSSHDIYKHYYVDAFNQEFSRDIEPAKYGIRDNYYCQMVQLIRTYKGARAVPAASGAQTINQMSDWSDVTPQYLDDVYDTTHRYFRMNAEVDPDHEIDEYYTEVNGMGYYQNTTGRNDIDTCKVTRDASYVYFYVKTREDMTEAVETDWLSLFINIDDNFSTGWYGYDFLINRQIDTENMIGSVEACNGSWSWRNVGYVDLVLEGDELMIAVPRALLGLTATGKLTFDFKWSDNACYDPVTGMDIMQFYDRGDAAPNGRFNYRYAAEYPAFSGATVTMPNYTLDIHDYPDVSAWILGKVSSSVAEADSVKYLSKLNHGTIEEGVYIPHLSLGAYTDNCIYEVYSADGACVARGLIKMENIKNANTISFKNVSDQEFVVDYKTNVATLTVPYNTKFWDITMLTNAPGTVTINDIHVGGSNLFYFTDNNTDLPLTYSYNGETVTYSLSVVRREAQTAVTNVQYNLPCAQLPQSADLWHTQHWNFKTATYNDTFCIVPNSMSDNTLLALKEKFPTPYSLTFMAATPGANGEKPSNMCFVNVRSTSGIDFPTEYRGIWFGVMGTRVYLLTGNTNFLSFSQYAYAEIPDAVNINEGLGTFRITDNGVTVVFEALNASGSYTKIFTLSDITVSGFHYTNNVTGETGSGVTKKGGTTLNGGYMAFFHHGGCNVYLSAITVATAYEPVEVGLALASIIDASTGREVSNAVAIDNTARTISITVDPSADLTNVRFLLVPTVTGNVTMRLNNKLYRGTVVDMSASTGKLLFVGGGSTKNYTYTIERGIAPRFELSGTAAYSVAVSNADATINVSVGTDFDLSDVHFTMLSTGEMTVNGKPVEIAWFNFLDSKEGNTVVYRESDQELTYTLNFLQAEPEQQLGIWEQTGTYGGAASLATGIWRAKVNSVFAPASTKYGLHALGFKDPENHHLLVTESPIASPFVFEYEVAVTPQENKPMFGSFVNLRSTKNEDYPTAAAGIWFSVMGDTVYLYKNPTNLGVYKYYSAAKLPEMVSAATGYATIRITDSGDSVTLEVKTQDGSFVKLFSLINIGSGSYSYTNCITGESGLGTVAAGTIANPGYMAFFSHAPTQVWIRNLSFYKIPELTESVLETFSLHDQDGNTVTTEVSFNQEDYPYSIEATVAKGTDLSALSVCYGASVVSGKLSYAGAAVDNQSIDFTNPVKLAYHDGVTGRTYTVTVQEAVYAEETLQNENTVKIRFSEETADEEAFFVVAYYDATGRMLYAKPQTRSIDSGINVLTAEVQKFAPLEAVTARLFLWNSPGEAISITELMN